MKLLLDTHIWLWGLLEPERLSPSVRAALQSPDNELWLSPISVWEALLLVERGRLSVTVAPADWVRQVVRAIPHQRGAADARHRADESLPVARASGPGRPVSRRDRARAGTDFGDSGRAIAADERVRGHGEQVTDHHIFSG